MPTLSIQPAAASADVLRDLDFTNIGPQGGILNAWGATATEGETINISHGASSEPLAPNCVLNLEALSGTVDVSRDQIVFNEVVFPGQLKCQIPAVTANMRLMFHLAFP